MTTVALHTLGCRLNHSETEVLARSFRQCGYTVVTANGAADVLVVNTCTVTAHSDSKSRQTIRSLHRKHPDAEIAVIGCYAQMAPEQIAALAGVRVVVGSEEKLRLPDLLEQARQHNDPLVLAPTPRRRTFYAPIAPLFPEISSAPADTEALTRSGLHTRAALKIQDGCDFMCSFCIIPFARGRSRHRDFGNLLEEARMLAEEGVREVVLTGVNVGTYEESGRTIVEVVDALAEQSGLARVRISSIEPTTVPPALFERMADATHPLVPFLHLPLQSGAEAILQQMKRRYSVRDYAAEVEHACRAVPDLCVGTDVMVGFPGETPEDFEETRALLADLPVSYFHVFPFSVRKNTPAEQMDTQLPPEVKQERGATLRSLSQRKQRMFQERFLGRTRTVLCEAPKADGRMGGFTDNYLRVELKGGFPELHNQLVPVQLSHIRGAVLVGQAAT